MQYASKVKLEKRKVHIRKVHFGQQVEGSTWTVEKRGQTPKTSSVQYNSSVTEPSSNGTLWTVTLSSQKPPVRGHRECEELIERKEKCRLRRMLTTTKGKELDLALY